MIECSHLSKDFGDVKAVNDLSFTAHKGQVLGFLGPNGAGKSTTMKMITGFLPPTTGDIKVCDIDLAEDAIAVKNKIGYLPEGAPSYHEMKVGPFLQFIARMRNIPRAQQQGAVDSVVARLNLNHVYYQKIDTLSKGLSLIHI